jgi:uncharacterized protein (TIGR02145 family)
MKNSLLSSSLLVMGIFLTMATSCKKDNNSPETVTDADGNVYHTITIGTQTWMVENLKATKYNDGTGIPIEPDQTNWKNLSTPAYCWHENNIANKNIYGALYNAYVVNTGKLAPKGWHVPSDAEWTTLENYLGGSDVAGGKLKSSGITYWKTPNTDATNESGFSGLPGGSRHFFGNYQSILEYGCWWATDEDGTNNLYRLLSYSHGYVTHLSVNKREGLSIRCVKD